MKAILLAFSFLLLFSVIVFLNHKANREFILASDLYLKKQALLEKFYSKFQKDLYETAHPDPKTPEQNKSNEVKEHVIIKRSIFNRDNEKGKVNLAFLIDHERYPATKERIAEALLEMYGASSLRPALIQTKEEAMGLLEDIGEAMKNASASDLLCDLKLSRHRAMFYHLLQGTQKFDIEKKLGFVPFQDLFMFYTSNAKTVLFCNSSSLTSIKLLFKKEFVEEFMQEEKNLYPQGKSKLAMPAWKSLIQKDEEGAFAEEASQWISFSSKGPSQIKSVLDDKDTSLRLVCPPMDKSKEEQE